MESQNQGDAKKKEHFSQLFFRRQYLFFRGLHFSAYPQTIIKHDSKTYMTERTLAYNKCSNKIIKMFILQQYYHLCVGVLKGNMLKLIYVL